MKVTLRMIDRQLRARGLAIKLINNTFTPTRLRIMHRMMKRRTWRIRSDAVRIGRAVIERQDGSSMRVLIFSPPERRGEVPGVLWLHGGGYAIGAPEQALRMAEMLNAASDCVIVAPDYRLSIEAPYPAALHDSYAAMLWMRDHAAELGIRRNQLMVGGESAGGGLAAALCFYARDRGEVAIAYQMPLYPMLDDRMNSASAKGNNAPLWNSRSNETCWRLYLGEKFGSVDVPYYAAPARATDYSGLPPAVTFVGALEPFRDETVTYVENLRREGVAVDFAVYEGCYHGFDVVCPGAAVSMRATALVQESFKRAAIHCFAEQPPRRDAAARSERRTEQ